MNPLPYLKRRPLTPVLAAVLGLSWLQADATLVCGPMLQGAATTNIYVLAECTVDATSTMTVNFGLTTGYGSTASTASTRTTTASPVTYVHVIKLTGLQPDTLYHYQLTGQGTTSADCTFRTLVNPGTAFRWAWTADFRNGTGVHGQISDRIRLNHASPKPPLFNLTGGDYASDNVYDNWKTQWLTSNELALEKAIPVCLTPGNHDGWAAGSNMQAYDQPPDSSGTAGYYSFDCGDLHVIMGNAYGTGYGVGSAQYNWIQQDVKASLKPWKIMGFHDPAYTYSSDGHGNDSGFVTLTTNLLEPNGVKVVLAGHNHFYQRNLINGIHHITCGAAGAPLYYPVDGVGTQESARDNCYLIGDVTPTTLTMVVYNNLGVVLDTILLTKPAAPTGLASTPSNSQVGLTWGTVPGVTSYTVYYGTTPGGPYPSKTTATNTSTTVTGLTNGTPYYFVVTATDANGPSAISTQSTATPNLNLPKPPTISNVADQTIDMNGNTGALAFTIGDPDTDLALLTVTCTSSNTALVPQTGIALAGSAAARTVTVTPASGQTGTATLTLTVSDGALTASDTFLLTVLAGQVTVVQWQSVNNHGGTPQGLVIADTGFVEPRQGRIKRLEVTFSAGVIVGNPSTAVTVSGVNSTGPITPASLGYTVNAAAAGNLLAITFANGGTPVALPDAANWRFTLNPAVITGTGGLVLTASAATTRVVAGLVGDVNGNGRVTGVDLNRISHAGAFNPATVDCLRADIDGNAQLDSSDLDAAWANRAQRTDTLAVP